MEAVNTEKHLLVFNQDPCMLWKHTDTSPSFPVAQTDLSDSQVQEGWQNVAKTSSPADIIQMGVWGSHAPLYVTPLPASSSLPREFLPGSASGDVMPLSPWPRS